VRGGLDFLMAKNEKQMPPGGHRATDFPLAVLNFGRDEVPQLDQKFR
jgi:hypothetical protein